MSPPPPPPPPPRRRHPPPAPVCCADAVDLHEIHPSLGALLAWRYCQLLTALPRRGTEAAGWERLARAFHEAPLGGLVGGGVGSTPEVLYGALTALKGEGPPGRGVVLDMACRRALPCAPRAHAPL